ncbi:hypothetical protein F4803DRAFT_545199 [Xylaria telfairii]|nr:hypothetical protein F4803DRAFT_545199 [Xylaria telfairii]
MHIPEGSCSYFEMQTQVRYIKRSPVFEHEKAFSIDYPVDHVPQARDTNQEEDMRTVAVTPITDPGVWDLDVHGFCFLKAKTDLTFHDASGRRTEVQGPYWESIITLMHQKFPGRWSRIEAFDFTVRKRVSGFPGTALPYRTDHVPPAITAHSDYSQNGAYMAMGYSFPGQEAVSQGQNTGLGIIFN